jgi:hypothetical protein
MWIVWNHNLLKGNKVLSEVEGFYLLISSEVEKQ